MYHCKMPLRLKLNLLTDHSMLLLFLDDNVLDLQLNMQIKSQNILYLQHPILLNQFPFLKQQELGDNCEHRIYVQDLNSIVFLI